jgi:cysteinyl-tRNA synthetase
VEEVIGLVAMGALVAFALVKAYTNKVLTQLRTEATRVIASERHVRQQMELEESQLESSEARLTKVEDDKESVGHQPGGRRQAARAGRWRVESAEEQ